MRARPSSGLGVATAGADENPLHGGGVGGAPGAVPSRAGGAAVSLPASCSPCLPPRLLLSLGGSVGDFGRSARRHADTPCFLAGPTAHGSCLGPTARHEHAGETARPARRRAGPGRPVGYSPPPANRASPRRSPGEIRGEKRNSEREWRGVGRDKITLRGPRTHWSTASSFACGRL